MAIDQSIVVYPKTDSVEMDNGKTRRFPRLKKEDLDEINSWWESELRRHANKQKNKEKNKEKN